MVSGVLYKAGATVRDSFFLQVSGAGVPDVQEKDLGHHGLHAEGDGRVPSPHCLNDCREDGTICWSVGMVVPPCRGGPGGGGTVAHVVVHQ